MEGSWGLQGIVQHMIRVADFSILDGMPEQEEILRISPEEKRLVGKYIGAVEIDGHQGIQNRTGGSH